MGKKIFGILTLICLAFHALSQTPKEKWVDSVFQTLNTTEQYGQMLMVKVTTSATEADLSKIEKKVRNSSIGGILFQGMTVKKMRELTTRFQLVAQTPLLFAIEGNGFPQTRDSLELCFPNLLTQGAIEADTLIQTMAAEVAKIYKSAGIGLSLFHAETLTADQINANNSYGDDRLRVSQKDLAWLKGMQSQGILTCAKDFPIRGVKVTHVEKGEPEVVLTADSLETYPFKVLFKNELSSVMPASQDLPLFYTEKKAAIKNIVSAGTLTASFAGNWIRQNMDFHGVIMIDVDDMVRASDKFAPGEAELFAFEAGNDMLITGTDPDPALRKFKKYFKKEKGSLLRLDESVRKVLAMKYDAGLDRKLEVHDISAMTAERKLLQKNLYRSAVTVIRNEHESIPLKSLEDRRFIFLVADDSLAAKPVLAKLKKYAPFTAVNLNDSKEIPDLTLALRPKHVVVVAMFPSSKEETIQKVLSSLATPDPNREVIVADFGSVIFRNFAQFFPTVITAYSDDREMLTTVPEIIFGGLPAKGSLPLSFGKIPSGTSVKTSTLERLSYSFPEEVGMDSKTLDKIEAIANEAIANKATPGCHVLVAKNGKVIYERSFGYLTYENQIKVSDETIYDLASVTKVSATLQAVMFMYERGLIDINKKASVYLPELKNSNKKDFVIKDILTHQAGLWPFLPFWAQTMRDSLYLPEYYNDTLSAEYPLVVADKLYGRATMKDSLWTWIIKSKIREKPARTPFDYRYSDMGFYIMQHLAERLLNQPIEDFVSQNFYEPLGAYTTGYLPLLRFPIKQIAPTENDKLFRKSLLIGMVHDQGAAMHGGVAGHAGLFSSANDLAKLGQMLLQEGEYGGIRYYKPETVRLFTRKQFETSRRGLGWDKPTPGDWNGPTSYYSSARTFGHTGFTGTCIWVDPEFQLVYIFLSNRVHPDMTNNKLLNANIRSRIQDVLYQSIFNYCKTAGEKASEPVSLPIQALGQTQ